MLSINNMEDKDNNSTFSNDQLELISDQSYIRRKNELIRMVSNRMARIESEIQEKPIQSLLPQTLRGKRGKISKGENYLGMPWVALDAPAVFERKSILAFRHLFLWGYSLSVNLHISGHFLEHIELAKLKNLKNENWFHLTGADAFLHHYEANIHSPIKELNEDIIGQQGYLKLVSFTSLKDFAFFERNCFQFIEKINRSGLIRNL